MHPNLISYAVPIFFVAIVVEAAAGARARKAYRLGCAVSDLDVGIASQVAEVFLKGLGLLIYAAVYRHRWVTLPEGSPWPFVIGIVGIDFLYYWWHRASHVVNILWAVHAVHHQSEDMNFAVALRQPAFEALTIIPFHLPLAMLGVEPWIYVSCYAVDLIYQFWVHTELTRRHATLEWILNTPSAHRVHHGINAKYLDKNYGGIFLIWDRLFGTYQGEEERPVYGVTHPLGSYNPIWANFAPFVEIAKRVRAARGLDKLGVLFGHPGRQAAITVPVTRESWTKYDPSSSSSTARYVFFHFVILALSSAAFLSIAERQAPSSLVIPASLVLASTLALSAWTERRRWALSVDVARQVATVVFLGALIASSAGLAIGAASAVGLAVVFAVLFAALRPSHAIA